MLGLGTSLTRAGASLLTYIKDGLKLYMPYKGSDASEVKFVGTGSTSFDGDDYVDCGDPIITGTGDYTFCAWIKKGTDTGAVRTVAGNYAGGAGLQGIQFSISASEKFYTYTDGTNDYVTGATDIPLNTWTHVASTRSSNNAVVYVNGVSDATGTLDNDIVGGLDFTIARNPGGGEVYTGNIKNVAIWSRALTATEIQNVMYKSYAEVSGRLGDSTLVSWWALDADSLGSDLVTDGDMELSGTTNWVKEDGLTVSKDTSVYYAGSQSLKLVSASGSLACTQTISATTTNAVYQVTGYYKTTGTARIYCGNTTNYTTLVAAADWTAFSENIAQASGSGTSFIIMNHGGATSNWDNIVAKEIQVEDLKGSNDGTVVGATIDEDLYGGDTPVKPRAIDNAPTVQADAIGVGSALLVASNTDYIDCGDAVSTISDYPFTVTGWFKAPTESRDGNIVVINDESTDSVKYGVLLRQSSGEGELRIFAQNPTTRSATTSGTNEFNDNTWHHFAGVFASATDHKLYADGIYRVQNTTSATFNSDTDSFVIGLNNENSGLDKPFRGNIAQIGLWQGALTQATIQSVMEKTFAELTASEKTNLVSYWALDEAVGEGNTHVVDKVNETFGSELVDSNVASSWYDNSDGSTIADITNGVSIADDSSYSDQGYFRDSYLLTTDLTLGSVYKISYDAYHNGVGTPVIRINNGSASVETSITSSNASYTQYITVAGTATDAHIRTNNNSSGSIVYLTNLSIKLSNGNYGTLT